MALGRLTFLDLARDASFADVLLAYAAEAERHAREHLRAGRREASFFNAAQGYGVLVVLAQLTALPAHMETLERLGDLCEPIKATAGSA